MPRDYACKSDQIEPSYVKKWRVNGVVDPTRLGSSLVLARAKVLSTSGYPVLNLLVFPKQGYSLS